MDDTAPKTPDPRPKTVPLHAWDLTPSQAIALQKQLCSLIRTDLALPKLERVAGVDVAYEKSSGESVAAVCVLNYPELELLDLSAVRLATPFPYIPGLLSFREVPPILRALRDLRKPPQLILVDGHGQAHPRRLGIASHLGLWLETPTIGVGKSRLCGQYSEPLRERGSSSDLVDRGDVVGRVLRTRSGVKPIFVSVGYGLPLGVCEEWTLRLSPRYRIPEPIRFADREAARLKKEGRPGS